MHHDFLDRYSRLESPVHRLSPGFKVSAALLLVLVSVTSPIRWVYPFIAVAAVLAVAGVMARLPAGFLLKRILFFEPFVAAIAFLALFAPGGGIIFTSMIVKSTLSLVTMILLSNTTPFGDLLGLLRRIRAPGVFVTILALMYRYLFVLIDEFERIDRARKSRTFTPGRYRAWFISSTVLGALLLRSTERAGRIYAAMCARGWK
jgi:cobalt/nickel transport system permease protein